MKTIVIAAAFSAIGLAQAPTPGKQIRIQRTVEAQQATPVEGGNFIFSNGTQTMQFISGMSVGPTVTNAPYSAEEVTESIQTLYDGNRIVHRSSTKQYRDSEGRERREEGAPLNVVFISDPVAKVSYALHPDTMTTEKMAFGGGGAPNVTAITAAFPTKGVVRTRIAPPEVFPDVPGTFSTSISAIELTRLDAKKEELGTRMIEGVECVGTRSTSTIAAGEIGNDRAIDIVDERWYSPELQVTVLSVHTDPRSGETIYKRMNIQRIEQVRSLFELPPGYTVREGAMFLGSPFPSKEE